MSQASPTTQSPQQHRGWLLEQLSASARTYLELAEQLAATSPESDEYATLEGDLYARINQLRFDADDIVEAMDADDAEGDERDE